MTYSNEPHACRDGCDICGYFDPRPVDYKMEVAKEPRVFNYEVSICEGCVKLEGAQCHTPGCVLIRKYTNEIEEILDLIGVRMKINGQLLIAEPLNECFECGDPIGPLGHEDCK